MNCLILGAKGMLGTELSSVFKDIKPILWDKKDLDITVEKEVEEKISALKPDVIINAAAYTAVDQAETNQDLANLVNGKAVEFLAALAKKLNILFIHYSTDYVFEGKKKKGYQENDRTNPINAYGRSKLIGENAVKNICEKYYLIRTSWLYGQNGKNFVETIIKLGREKDKVKVVDDQFGKPTYAVDLAKKTREIFELKKEYGIYHITNEGTISWYELAKEIFRQLKIKIPLLPISTSEFPMLAKRPKYSSLINTKLSPLRDWRIALEEYLANR